jgi:SAM-dependent methyltransferase
MTKILDPYCEQFIASCETATESVADLGVAFGYTTQKILQNKNLTVYANDIDKKHLDYLASEITDEERKRLKLFPGKLPEVFNFKSNSLSGVLAARCIHFLKGDEIEDLANKVYNSLIPGGIFCIVAETPYMKHTATFIPIFEKRKASGDVWPGYIDDFSLYTKRANTSKWINLLDPDILERTLKLIGFKIEKVGFIERPYFPEEVRMDGKESAGIIGRKI